MLCAIVSCILILMGKRSFSTAAAVAAIAVVIQYNQNAVAFLSIVDVRAGTKSFQGFISFPPCALPMCVLDQLQFLYPIQNLRWLYHTLTRPGKY